MRVQPRRNNIGMFGTDRTGHAAMTTRLATTTMTMIGAATAIGIAKAIMHGTRTRGDARLQTTAARPEALGNRRVCYFAERLARQEHRSAHADPWPKLRMQQQAGYG